MDNKLKVHFDSIVVDSHNDTMMKIIDKDTWLPKIDIGNNTENHIDIPKLKAGGMNVLFFAAFTSGYYDDTQKSVSMTLSLINALYWTEKNNEETFTITRALKDIEKAILDEKIAAVSTIEGGYSFDENNAMELLYQYYDLGIKAIAFNWNYSNDLGEGASKIYNDISETPSPSGLTSLGKKVVIEMNKLGMIIDVSHMSEATFWDTINISKSPIIASHSGVYSLRQHPRNLTDDQLKALAKNRGLIGIVFCPAFLTDGGAAYLKDYVDHIDYAVDLIGIDYVGIGSDFDGASLPKDIKNSSELYKVTEELIKRGYKEEEIEKLLGKNTLRVLRQVEDAAEYNHMTFELGLHIIPSYSMGEIISDFTPLITAKVEIENGLAIDNLNSRIIVDGISYESRYDKESYVLSLKINEPLREKFHVVTFEVKNSEGKIQRETRIFYVKE